MTNGLDKRLAKLEAEGGGEVIAMWQHFTETAEQAEERWRREHPGRDPDKAGTHVYIMRWSYPDDVVEQAL